MKNSILVALLLICGTGGIQAQQLPIHQNCETPKEVCSSINESYNFHADSSQCLKSLYYFLDNNNTSGPSLHIFGVHSGQYILAVLHGPFTNNSIVDACTHVSQTVVPTQFGSTALGASPIYFPLVEGYYILEIKFQNCATVAGDNVVSFNLGVGDEQLNCNDLELPCENCITSFSPNPGQYIVSGWVMEENSPITTTSYTNSGIIILFNGDTTQYGFLPSGQIIDGWQKIEGVISIPPPATGIKIIMAAGPGTTVYFDDIRFFPTDGSMMSYVYDPQSLRLIAELDERNYATFYEYDEEGKLVRVKKETERGVMTIQENRDNIKKQ